MIIICGALIGSELRGRLRARVKILDEYETVCVKMMSMIKFQKTPIDRLIARMKDSESDIFSLCALYVDEGEDFRCAWEKAIEASDELRLLDEEERQLIALLGDSIGRSDCDGEMALLEDMRASFAKASQKARAEQTEKSRVYSVCGLLGGIMCALMVI